MPNSLYRLLSLGVWLATAADNNKDMGISAQAISFIGWLIQLVSDLAIACYITRTNLSAELITKRSRCHLRHSLTIKGDKHEKTHPFRS